MKKLLCVVLVLCILLGVTACGRTPSSSSVETSSSEQSSSSEESSPSSQLSVSVPPVSPLPDTDQLIKVYIRSGLANYTWNSWQEADIGDFTHFVFAIMQFDKTPYKDTRDGGFYNIPANILEAQAAACFDFPAEALRTESGRYDATTDTYNCYDVFSGVDSPWNQFTNVKSETVDGQQIIRFDRLNADGGISTSNTITIQQGSGGGKLISGKMVRKDFVAFCVNMNVAFVDQPFTTPSDLTAQQMFSFAMWAISTDRLHYTEWNSWQATDNGLFNIPLSVVQETLAFRLGDGSVSFEKIFHPEKIESYNPATKTFLSGIGGYGGVRFPKVQSSTRDGDKVTLVIAYYGWEDFEGDPSYTYTYVLQITGEDNWRLLSVAKK